MIPILTYQDLKAIGPDEKKRMEFIVRAIKNHKSSAIYQTAVDAKKYYDGENPTINQYEKIIYDMQGRAHKDMYTANHKIASSFFGLAVDQETSYLLGNGVSFKKPDTKDHLGKDDKTLDIQVQTAGEYALIGGVAFGFWNLDHIDVFEITEFVPLEDDETAGLMAGIRFWQIDDTKPLRATLYELDGYTEYIMRQGEDMAVLKPKRSYRLKVSGDNKDRTDGTEILNGENYPSFPIVPLKNNRQCKSELVGKRNTIDALDLACSNMVNNVDEGNLIYWVLTNFDGMDEADDQAFIDQLHRTHVAHAGKSSEGSTVDAHTIEAPYVATETAIERLNKQLYQDFRAFNSGDVTASNQSATAIDAAYTNLDLKADKFERQVTKFIKGIMKLAGIEDDPSYTRNKIINKMEELQAVAIAAPTLDEEYVARKNLTILGDSDMADEILKRRAADDLDRLGGGNEPINDEQEEQNVEV